MSCFSECPEQLSLGRKPKEVQAFSPSISWDELETRLPSVAQTVQAFPSRWQHYLTPHLMNRFAPRGWNCSKVYYEISFTLHESVLESQENKIWKVSHVAERSKGAEPEWCHICKSEQQRLGHNFLLLGISSNFWFYAKHCVCMCICFVGTFVIEWSFKECVCFLITD